jgi:hypothetical protein
MLTVTTFFLLQTPFSYQEIFLMQTIRREIATYSRAKAIVLGTLVTLQHTMQPSLHMSQKDKYEKKNKNINFNDNFHFTLHS